VSEPLLAVLRVCVLALLYLFFLRVLRAVWVESRPMMPRRADAAPRPASPPPVPAGATTLATATAAAAALGTSPPVADTRRRVGPDVAQLVVLEPVEQQGRSFELVDELTIGRAPGCHITVDDGFVSQLHARVFRRDEDFMIEDLGSTNGTYHNRHKVTAAVILRPGDHVQIGNTILERR
jgi:hypothetical protein